LSKLKLPRTDRMGLVGALIRVDQAIDAAKEANAETVTLHIDDISAYVIEANSCRDSIALGRKEWRERWFGSGPDRGSMICAVTGPFDLHGEQIAHFGDAEGIHQTVSKIVLLHNARLSEHESAR